MSEMNPQDEFDSLSGSAMPGIDDAPDIAGLRDELERTRKQVEDQRSLYVRALADFENYKKRIERDQRSLSDFGRRELLKKLLPAIDNLQRAAEYRARETPPEQIVDGVLATVKQFESLLESEGLRRIDTVGKTFDPVLSEAVGTAPNSSVPDNTVVNEARPGYMIGDEVLRPAQVIVSKHDG